MRKEKIFKIYRDLPSSVKASVWFAICSILQKAIQFITIPLFTRLLSTEEYGQFTLYQSWLSVFSIFATLNLSYGVFNNGMVKYEKDKECYISSMQGLSVLCTVVVATIYFIAKPIFGNLTNLSDSVMVLLFVQILFTPPLSFWSARQRFEYKYKFLVGVTLLISIATPLVGLAMVYSARDKGFARIFSSAVISIVVGAVFMVYNAIKGKIFYNKQYWSFALKFNLPLIPHYLSMIILGQSDRIMIGQYYGERPVAIYGLAYSLSLIMNIVTSSINSSLIPWTYQQCKSKNYQKIGQVADAMLLGIGLACLVPAIIAPELLAVLGPKEYAEGAYLVAPISLSVFFTFLYSLFANIEFYFEKSKFVMIASVSGAGLNVVLNLLLLPILGYQVAAYTTLFCYGIFAIAHYSFMKKVCKEQKIAVPIYNIKRIIVLSVAIVIMAQGIMFTYNHLILRVMVIILIGAVAFVNRKRFLSKLKMIKSKEF